jgi:drug/metabolite transporter (DMT)-like permease
METVKIIAMLTLAVFSQSVGNVLLSKGMKDIAGTAPGLPTQWVSLLAEAAVTPGVLLGAALFVVFFVLWTTALSRADLSFVLPAVSFEVVLNVLFANWFLDETVSPIRWAGIALISVGVLLVARSGVRTFDEPASRPVRLDEVCG